MVKQRRAPTTTILVNGEALREVRKLKGIDLNVLAQRLDISRGHLNNIELGYRPRVRPPLFVAIVRELDLDDGRAIMADEPVTAGSAA